MVPYRLSDGSGLHGNLDRLRVFDPASFRPQRSATRRRFIPSLRDFKRQAKIAFYPQNEEVAAVWVAFVDDTKQCGLRRDMGQLLALGAVAFNEDQLAAYSATVNEIFAQHSIPQGTELKWSCRKQSWFKTEPGAKVLTQVRKECLVAAACCEARATVVVFDLGRTTVQGQAAETKVLTYLYERISMMLPADARGVVVCDKPGGSHKDEDAWISRTLELTCFGTNYIAPGNVVLPILTAPSHHHPHLQLADLIAGSVTAAVSGVKYGLDLVPALRPLLHASPAGGVPGTGLKLFPDDLLNLYHWVLDETSYIRQNQRRTLPDPRLPYASDDGVGRLASFKSKRASRRLGATSSAP